MPDLFSAILPSLRQRRIAFNADVDDLIRSHGVNAYQVAISCCIEANDLSGARYWGRVKSEIGRRIVERSSAFDEAARKMPDPSADYRAEARRLAIGIGDARYGDAANRSEEKRLKAEGSAVPPSMRMMVGGFEEWRLVKPLAFFERRPPKPIAGQRLHLRVIETSHSHRLPPSGTLVALTPPRETSASGAAPSAPCR